MNKRLGKQLIRRWFKTHWRSLCHCHCNVWKFSDIERSSTFLELFTCDDMISILDEINWRTWSSNGARPSADPVLTALLHISYTKARWLSVILNQIWVNIGSDNGLVPSGYKPLSAPMLTHNVLQNSRNFVKHRGTWNINQCVYPFISIW